MWSASNDALDRYLRGETDACSMVRVTEHRGGGRQAPASRAEPTHPRAPSARQPHQSPELRSLLRTRKQLTREQTRHVQRIHKTLEEGNIKLGSVITEIMGLSGRRMIEAMISGVRNPWKLAELAHHRIKATRKELYDALHGRLTDHHRFMLRLHLGQYDTLERAIAELDQRVDAAIAQMDAEVAAGQATFRPLIALLCTIPGVSDLAAKTILAEIGTDMGRFPTAAHLVSWAGLCPGQNESAGKRKSSRLRKGAPWLKTLLVQCGFSASGKKPVRWVGAVRRGHAASGNGRISTWKPSLAIWAARRLALISVER
jgi:transposase